MSSTLGAPLGGTTRGAHHGFDSATFSLITAQNFGSGGGSSTGNFRRVSGDHAPETCKRRTGVGRRSAARGWPIAFTVGFEIVAVALRARLRPFMREKCIGDPDQNKVT
jgi:hypothetical protein